MGLLTFRRARFILSSTTRPPPAKVRHTSLHSRRCTGRRTPPGSPRRPPRRPFQPKHSCRPEALQTEREPVTNRGLKAPATIKELEEKYTTWVVDTPNANGKITVRIAADGRAFGLVVGACKVQRGTVFLLPGHGGVRLEADALKSRSSPEVL